MEDRNSPRRGSGRGGPETRAAVLLALCAGLLIGAARAGAVIVMNRWPGHGMHNLSMLVLRGDLNRAIAITLAMAALTLLLLRLGRALPAGRRLPGRLDPDLLAALPIAAGLSGLFFLWAGHRLFVGRFPAMHHEMLPLTP